MKKLIIITTSTILLPAIMLGMYLLNGCQKDDSRIINFEISFLDSVDFSGVYTYCELLSDAVENNIIQEELYSLFDEINNTLTKEEICYLPTIIEYPIYNINEKLQNDDFFKSIYCKCLINNVIKKYLPKTTIDEYLINNCNIGFNDYSFDLRTLKSGTLQECYQSCQNSYNVCIEGAEDAYDAYVADVSNTYLECDENASQLPIPFNYEAHLICLAAYTYGMNAAAEYYAEASESCSNSLDQCIANCDELHGGGAAN